MTVAVTYSRQTGFTLVELMISITLGLLLMSLVVPAFIGNMQTFKFSTGVARTQETARAALGEMARNIRMVGYTGCNSRDLKVVNLTGDTMYDVAPGVFGYERKGAESIPGLENAGVTLTDAADVITLKTLADAGAKLAAPVAASATEISIRSGHSLAAGDTVFIGDCEGGTIVGVTSVSDGKLTLASALPSGKRLRAATAIYRVEVATYFLAASQLYVNNRNAAPSSLWRKINNGEAEELVVGVETLQLLYGLDTNGDGAANVFDTAEALGDQTHQVVVVRFQAVTNSIDSVGSAGTISRPFTISVSLRNKTPTQT